MKNLLLRICTLLPFWLGKRLFRSAVLIINYHSIEGADADPSINAQNKYRTVEELEADLRFYKQHFHILNLKEFISHKFEDVTFPKNSILITIDDGLRPVYELMFPVFKKWDVPATIFLNNAFIDNKDLHFERKALLIVEQINMLKDNSKLELISKILGRNLKSKEDIAGAISHVEYAQRNKLDEIANHLDIDFSKYLQLNKPYLNTEEVKSMLDNKFTVGGHSIDHPNYLKLSVSDQVDQTIKSIDEIQKLFELDYRVFAFPYKDEKISKEFFGLVEGRLDASFGTDGIKHDSIPFNHQRISIERTGVSARTALNAEFVKYLLRLLTNKTRIKRW